MLTANTLLQYGSGKLLAFNKQLDPYVPNTFNAGSHDWVRVWRENWAAETSRSEKVAASKGHEPFDWNPAVQAVSLQDGVWCLVEHLGWYFVTLKNKNPILHYIVRRDGKINLQ